jgi:hypothetical protein
LEGIRQLPNGFFAGQLAAAKKHEREVQYFKRH